MSTVHVVRRVPSDGNSKRRLTAEEVVLEATGRYIDELGTAPEFRNAKCPPSDFKAVLANVKKYLRRAARIVFTGILWLIALAALIAHGGWIIHRLIHAVRVLWPRS